jgi:uncharacterized protein YeaO (DUF488 family)
MTRDDASKYFQHPTMPLKTKRWCDKAVKSDGWRILICRYRPRALKKADETWDNWYPELGPSRELHADFYGKNGPPITWEQYRERYLNEVKAQDELIDELAKLVAEGKTITLLCSSACTDESHCHRTLLRGLIEAKLPQAPDPVEDHANMPELGRGSGT